jgi:hypothetical protein
MVAACYRYAVLGILVAILVVVAVCAIDALAPDDSSRNWPRLLSLIVIAAVIGSLVSHVYDNKGTIKLPDTKADEVQLAVFGDILIGILAAFAAIYLLHATLKADLDLSPGVALLAGLAGTRLIPGFRDSIARQLKTLEQDVKEGEKKLTARDYHQWGDLKAAQCPGGGSEIHAGPVRARRRLPAHGGGGRHGGQERSIREEGARV